jgi:hypothetical protein
MLAGKLLHEVTKKSCPTMHGHRRASFFAGVSSLLRFRRLTVTGLGQGIKNKTKVKHNINRMNRLVGFIQMLGARAHKGINTHHYTRGLERDYAWRAGTAYPSKCRGKRQRDYDL